VDGYKVSDNRVTIMKALTGSRLYGTHTEQSDYDYITVELHSPREYLLGTTSHSSQREQDSTYEFRFFVKLCTACNLNVLPVLWAPTLQCDPFSEGIVHGLHIRLIREKFLSQKLKATGTGYALQCIAQAENVDRPTGQLGANRKAIIEQYGYDTKAAMHALRLVRMTKEYLQNPEQGLNVVRKDAEELIKVRNGGFTLQQIADEVRGVIKQIDKIKTTAPAEPDREAIDNFVVDVLRSHLGCV
jgi:hypothetical protein